MIPAHVAQERNTKNAADLTKHSYRGLHRMLTQNSGTGSLLSPTVRQNRKVADQNDRRGRDLKFDWKSGHDFPVVT
jgi:hypothetical protein